MSGQYKKRPQNKGSELLSEQENNALFRLLDKSGGQKYTLATGVVQLLATEPPRHREWQKKFVGVVCFIKDYAEKGYFLRLYDITKREQLWEQPFYDGFLVDQKSQLNVPELVTFEGDDCVYGLNFSSIHEANEFARQVNRRYEQEQKIRNRTSAAPVSNPPFSMSTTSQNIIAPTPQINFGNGGKKWNKKKDKKLTKSDISLPTNFEHRVHVGWDPGQGFQTNASSREDLDPQIKMLLDKIGMPTNIRKKDMKMVYDIIEQNGGMAALQNELSQPPPPPSRSPPQVPTATYPGSQGYPPRNDRPTQQKARDLPPQPSVMTNNASNNSRPLPQPPSLPMQPPAINRPGPPPPPSAPPPGHKNVAAPPPPPPPPPPPSGIGAAAPPPPPPPPPPVSGGVNFLAEIAHGVSLKPVQSSEGMHTSRSSDSRDAMLSDIKGGVALRPVDRQEKQRVSPPEELGGIAGALARALQDRRFQISDDTESDDDNDDDDEDEWDD